MSEDLTIHQADEVPCANSECDNQAVEPELDGDYQYFECEICGYAWGYTKIEETSEGSCSLGIPESVRRAASAPMEGAIAASAPVSLGTTIGKRPGL